jgi:hypothetical protein
MRVNVEYSGRLGELGDYCFKDCRGKWGREIKQRCNFLRLCIRRLQACNEIL